MRILVSLLLLGFLCSCRTPPAPAAGRALRIVCIGDSITQGRGPVSASGESWTPTAGWRWAFWKKLVDAGIGHRFVGTMTEGFESTPAYPSHKGQSFGNRHEARWGWTTEAQLQKLRETGREWTADLALIYLGNNREKLADAETTSDRAGVARTAAAMRGIFRLLRANNPKMIIVVRSPVGDDARPLGLQAAYREIASEFNRPDAPALFIPPPADWQWDPQKTAADTIDGCHPNPRGDEKIARDFFDAVRPLLKAGA